MIRSIICFLILLPFYSLAQKNLTPKIIRQLLSFKKEIPVISGWCKNLLPQNEVPKELQNEFQYLVKTKADLYCGINGTGRLYKITDSSNTLTFHRIDSTYHSGSDFFAANFVIGNNIYSFGGYGFWKSNGLLRYFNTYSKEWEVQKLTKEIPCNNFHAGSGFWVDTGYMKFYMISPVTRNEGLKSDTFFLSKNSKDSASNKNIDVLDVINGTWQELDGSFEYNLHLTQSPWGFWSVGNFYSTYIFNLRNNKIYHSSDDFNKKVSKIFDKIENNIWFFIDSTLYSGNIDLNTFDSLHVSINDFEDTGRPVYHSKNISNSKKISFYGWLLTICLIGLLSLAYILVKRKKYTSLNDSARPAEIFTQDIRTPVSSSFKNIELIGSSIFAPIEMELIRNIFDRNKQGHTVTAEEINKILGLSGKNSSIQKKNRSDMITSINRKWAAAYRSQVALIERQRSSDDKRSFEYFIKPQWVEKVKELF